MITYTNRYDPDWQGPGWYANYQQGRSIVWEFLSNGSRADAEDAKLGLMLGTPHWLDKPEDA